MFRKIFSPVCFLIILFTSVEEAINSNKHSFQFEFDGSSEPQSTKYDNVHSSMIWIVSSAPAYRASKAEVLYIDPGTGSLLFQILSAIILAVLFYLSLIRKTLARLFSKVKKIFSNQKIDS
jgi:hypothetical protein